MDNLGAIGGPLLALGLVALVGVRTAIALSVIPGLLARDEPRTGAATHYRAPPIAWLFETGPPWGKPL